MRFSFNWLKKYLDTQLNLQQISDKLTSIGLEVEEVIDPAKIFAGFKLVEIIKIEDHPNADKLHLCTVRDSEDKQCRIVCGAQNVRVGLKTVLAMEGAYIPEGQFHLKKSKIRGVVSEGMMCSREELKLPKKEEDGIIDLPADTDLSASVGDILGYEGGIIDISLTPDRGDCFGVKGIARDLAAAGAGKFVEPSSVICKASEEFPFDIQLDPSPLVQHYMPMAAFRVIRNIKNGESPEWLKNQLQIAGINSISYIVDLANWMMVDSGRPFHIYDLDKIEGNFQIRFARDKEEFIDLKDVKHELRDDMLVPADDNSVLCVFGVMGSKKTACTAETKNILIESALFDPIFISKTGTFLNIISDSRTRFERGIDKNSCKSGIETVTRMILDNCGGRCTQIRTFGDPGIDDTPVRIFREHLQDIGGCDIDWQRAVEILEKLGLKKFSFTESVARFKIPSWRSDLKIEEDLIAEILRIYGYDNIEKKPLAPELPKDDEKWNGFTQEMEVKRLLTTRKMSEVITYSFTKDAHAKAFAEDNKLIYLINPISSDMNTMRPSLIPNLLTTALRSLNFGKTSVKLFEVGHVFYNECEQSTYICGIRIGDYSERHWLNKARKADVFDVKADAMSVLNLFGIDESSISYWNKVPSYYHPYRRAALVRGRKILGYFGELRPSAVQKFGISERVECFELLLDEFMKTRSKKAMFNAKIFPKINRDFAFIFGARYGIGSLLAGIKKIDHLISKVSVFDRFAMDNGKVSIGISVSFEAPDRTLTENEAQELSEKIIQFVESKGGELRTK